MKVRGLVLAGGISRRFGEDKALALFAGKTFLERSVEILDQIRLAPIVVTRAEADYPFLTVPILRDTWPDQGPLGGLYTAWTVHPDTAFLVLTCDMPALQPKTLKKILEAFAKMPKLTLLWDEEKASPEPFPASIRPIFFQGFVRACRRESGPCGG